MISILAQERLLGFALGSVSMGGFVLHQRRGIYRSLADADAATAPSPLSYQSVYQLGQEVRSGSCCELTSQKERCPVKSAVEEAQLNWLTYGTRQLMRLSDDWLNISALVDGNPSMIGRGKLAGGAWLPGCVIVVLRCTHISLNP